MEEKTSEFGMKRERESEFEHIGKYVVLHAFNGGNYSSGKLIKIEKDYFILNPHQGICCNLEEGWKEAIVEENEYVPIYQTRIRPITKESFESSISLNNKRNLEHKLEQERLKQNPKNIAQD